MTSPELVRDPPPIYVTRPELPPLDELVPLLEEIWERRVHDAIAKRREVARRYRIALHDIERIRPVDSGNEEGHNFACFPVLVDRPYPLARDELVGHLYSRDIHCRRYFCPLLSDLSLSGGPGVSLPFARWAAQRIVCLPIYPSLDEEAQQRIVDSLRESLA